MRPNVSRRAQLTPSLALALLRSCCLASVYAELGGSWDGEVYSDHEMVRQMFPPVACPSFAFIAATNQLQPLAAEKEAARRQEERAKRTRSVTTLPPFRILCEMSRLSRERRFQWGFPSG
ncbi:uncharacterized protein IWZ02DRAFT_110713 [Phyllosticta citriasiana]|uniref:uncharacterized protein n=1 Tax=Phyllosticta citriasiana TaxID=595635 RepID=UPI0030FDCBDB